jgi:hypothetical protein
VADSMDGRWPRRTPSSPACSTSRAWNRASWKCVCATSRWACC